MPTASSHPTTSPDFRVLFESALSLYLVLTPSLVIVAASDAYLRATMTKREDVLGRSLLDVFPDNPDATGVRNLRRSLERVVRDRVPDVMAVQKYDIRHPELGRGGFEERYWCPVNSPVFGANGKLTCIIHRVKDVTHFVHLKRRGIERDRLAQELRTQGEQFEAEVFLRAQQIQDTNQKLREANEALMCLREDREHRVQERTAELRTTTQQLWQPAVPPGGPGGPTYLAG